MQMRNPFFCQFINFTTHHLYKTSTKIFFTVKYYININIMAFFQKNENKAVESKGENDALRMPCFFLNCKCSVFVYHYMITRGKKTSWELFVSEWKEKEEILDIRFSIPSIMFTYYLIFMKEIKKNTFFISILSNTIFVWI